MVSMKDYLGRLFPHEPITFVSDGYGYPCPVCGERRLTDCIYNHKLTHLCGFSRLLEDVGWVETGCQGAYFIPFIEMDQVYYD